MNKLILAGASIFALSMASGALAQSAPADPESPTPTPATTDCDAVVGNCSLAEQNGSGLEITVNQTGSGNVSDIDQVGGASATCARANVSQSGTGTPQRAADL